MRLTRATAVNTRVHYVYVLFRHNGDPVYVGKGTGSRSNRNLTNLGENKHLRAIIKKDLADGYPEPTRKILKDGLTANEAFTLEMRTIERYKRTVHGGTLTNMTNGGPGGEDGAETRRLERTFELIQKNAANFRKQSKGSFQDCLHQINSNSASARGVVAKLLFDKPCTISELCNRMRTMPKFGPGGGGPANKAKVGRAIYQLHQRLEGRSYYRLKLSKDNVFSIILTDEPPRYAVK